MERSEHSGHMVINVNEEIFNDAEKRAVLTQTLQNLRGANVNVDGTFVTNVGNVNGEPLQDAEDTRREEHIEQLRSNLNKMSLQAQSAKTPFTVMIRVLHADHQREPVLVLAKVDTQSVKNWVTEAIVQRLGLQSRVELLEPGDHYPVQGFEGGALLATERVVLTWYESIVLKTRETSFLVNSSPEPPFDLILGTEWIMANGASAFSDPVLALREMDLTDDANRQLQANLTKQTSSDKDLAPV